jgi:hypothetical protein
MHSGAIRAESNPSRHCATQERHFAAIGAEPASRADQGRISAVRDGNRRESHQASMIMKEM